MIVIEQVGFWLRIFQWWIRREQCCVVQNVSISQKNIVRWRDLLQPTQLYPFPMCNRSNRKNVSQWCLHWSPPFTQWHCSYYILHLLSIDPSSFNYLCISIITFFVTPLCIQPSPVSHSFCFPYFRHLICFTRLAAKKQKAGRMQDWEGLNAKSGEENIYYRTVERINAEESIKSRCNMYQLQWSLGKGWRPMATTGYVNYGATVLNGRRV